MVCRFLQAVRRLVSASALALYEHGAGMYVGRWVVPDSAAGDERRLGIETGQRQIT